VRVRGDARNPDVRVFSSPPMEENRALYYLLTGRAPAENTDTDLAVASVMMQMGLSGTSKLTGGLMHQFGIEDFQIDARKVEGGTEVHLSGYLTSDIQFRYGVSTFDKVNTFRLRYRLARQVFVEGISGVENAVDFLYSFER
jgi:translocation and assembly module TamB